MITFSLQSGSNGNAIYVEAAGVRLLFDGGISGRQARQRLAAHRRDIHAVHALILSHAHNDHIRCAGIYQRRFGLPIYATPGTHRTLVRCEPEIDVRIVQPGGALRFGRVTVHTLLTPHDAPDSVAFIIECEGRRLGILTDLGHPFHGLTSALRNLDGVYLESNYDPQMLAEGTYPPELQERIRGDGGHLSNHEAAELLRHCGRRHPRWVALAHLSEQNNHPELALETHRATLGRDYPLIIAGRYEVSALLRV